MGDIETTDARCLDCEPQPSSSIASRVTITLKGSMSSARRIVIFQKVGPNMGKMRAAATGETQDTIKESLSSYTENLLRIGHALRLTIGKSDEAGADQSLLSRPENWVLSTEAGLDALIEWLDQCNCNHGTAETSHATIHIPAQN